MKLTFLPFIVKAVVAALKKHPIAQQRASTRRRNELVDPQVLQHRDRGRDRRGPHRAGRARTPIARASSTIAREIERLGEDAQGGQGRSSRTSAARPSRSPRSAQQGGLFATPIINFPEVGILGVHQIKQKPVVRDGQIVIGDVMLLSLSFDHRIVDGHVGAAFAYDIIGYLEDPGSALPRDGLRGGSTGVAPGFHPGPGPGAVRPWTRTRQGLDRGCIDRDAVDATRS